MFMHESCRRATNTSGEKIMRGRGTAAFPWPTRCRVAPIYQGAIHEAYIPRSSLCGGAHLKRSARVCGLCSPANGEPDRRSSSYARAGTAEVNEREQFQPRTRRRKYRGYLALDL